VQEEQDCRKLETVSGIVASYSNRERFGEEGVLITQERESGRGGERGKGMQIATGILSIRRHVL